MCAYGSSSMKLCNDLFYCTVLYSSVVFNKVND